MSVAAKRLLAALAAFGLRASSFTVGVVVARLCGCPLRHPFEWLSVIVEDATDALDDVEKAIAAQLISMRSTKDRCAPRPN